MPVSLSKQEMEVLRLLVEENNLYGSQMVDRSEGRLKLSSVYVTLKKLAEKGVVTSEREDPNAPRDGNAPRRIYTLTEAGEIAYKEQIRQLTPKAWLSKTLSGLAALFGAAQCLLLGARPPGPP